MELGSGWWTLWEVLKGIQGRREEAWVKNARQGWIGNCVGCVIKQPACNAHNQVGIQSKADHTVRNISMLDLLSTHNCLYVSFKKLRYTLVSWIGYVLICNNLSIIIEAFLGILFYSLLAGCHLFSCSPSHLRLHQSKEACRPLQLRSYLTHISFHQP